MKRYIFYFCFCILIMSLIVVSEKSAFASVNQHETDIIVNDDNEAEDSKEINNFEENEKAEGTDIPLYNGMTADYNDPEFVDKLNRGFFSNISTYKLKNSYGSKHDEKFDGYDIENGIDVSKWNGNIDWKTVSKNKDFAIIRGAYRGTASAGNIAKDVNFDSNIKEASKAGIDVGVYIFSQAITEKEARDEANYILKLVKNHSIDLPIVIDYEFSKGGRLEKAKLSKSEHTKICLAFCDEVKKAGYKPMVYANYSMLTNNMYANQITSKGYEIWLARYNSVANYSGEYTYWQYSSSGRVSGITGNVDLDYHYLKPKAPKLKKISKYDGIQIEWEKLKGYDIYYIYRKVPGGYWSKIGTTKETKYLDTDKLDTNKKYIYTVRGYNGSERSYYDTSGLSIWNLETPKLIDAENASTGIKVSWNKVTGADSYYVYRKEEGGSSWSNLGKVKSTSYVDKATLKSGTKYRYTVRACKESSTSYFDANGISTIKMFIPKLNSIAKYDGIQISWGAVTGAEEYAVYRKVPGGYWSKIGTTKETKYLDTDKLDTNKKYIYTVRGYNGSERSYYDTSGLSIWNLETPKLIDAENASTGIKVSWNKVTGADSYYVYRKEEGGSSWSNLGKVKSTSYVDKATLKSGTKYRYTVRACKESSTSYFDANGISTIKI